MSSGSDSSPLVERDFLSYADTPAWFEKARREAWAEFQSLPIPTAKQELWRFTDIKKLTLSGYQLLVPVNDDDAEACLQQVRRIASSKAPAARFVFANDQLIDSAPLDKTEKGLICMPILEAIKAHPEVLQSRLHARNIALGAQKFLALHRAHLRSGLVLIIPPKVSLPAPIEVHHFLTKDHAACFPHLWIVAEENAEVEVIEYCHGLKRDSGGLCIGASDIHLKSGARVRLIRAQNWGEKACSYYINSSLLDRDASLMSLILNLGSDYARTESKSRLIGAGARSDMLSLSVPHGHQEFDQRTYQDHAAPHTSSDLLYKNALCDHARTIFSGMIRVEPSAQHTDAYQANRNLLLSDTAEANAMPGLEIEANEVRCTHGATTGQIDQEQLFYLLSRGLSISVARKLFIFGFFQDVFDRVKDPKLMETFTSLIDEKLKHDL